MKIEEAIKSNKFRNSIHKAGLNILYTAWWLKTITNATLKPFDISQEQYNVLRILNGKHPQAMCIKDISCRIIEKNSNVPRIIDKLEQKKLIVRINGEKDARQTFIQLTPHALSTLQLATNAINNVWDNTLHITHQEAEQLNDLLEKIRVNE